MKKIVLHHFPVPIVNIVLVGGYMNKSTTDDEDNVFYTQMTQRHRGLLSPEDQEKIKNTLIGICGLGSTGSVVLECLVRMGYTKLKISDGDLVEICNINRQILYDSHDIGHPKRFVAKEKIKRINPFIEVKEYDAINKKNIDSFLNGLSAVIDAMDDHRAKILLSRKASKLKIPIVHVSGFGHRGSVTVFMHNTSSYEELFRLGTENKKIEEISDEQLEKHRIDVINALGRGILRNDWIYLMIEKKYPWSTMININMVAGAIAAMQILYLTLEQYDKLIVAPNIIDIDVSIPEIKIRKFL